MTPFEYLLILVSIVISLAIADISTSLHRLLSRAGRAPRVVAFVRRPAYHSGIILFLLFTVALGWFPMRLGEPPLPLSALVD